MDAYLPYIFISNIILIFIDATIGYHAAPTLARMGSGDEAGTEWAVRGVRKLLAAVVALYMYFNCLGFFDKREWLLLVVTGVIVLDVVAQAVISGRMRRGKER